MGSTRPICASPTFSPRFAAPPRWSPCSSPISWDEACATTARASASTRSAAYLPASRRPDSWPERSWASSSTTESPTPGSEALARSVALARTLFVNDGPRGARPWRQAPVRDREPRPSLGRSTPDPEAGLIRELFEDTGLPYLLVDLDATERLDLDGHPNPRGRLAHRRRDRSRPAQARPASDHGPGGSLTLHRLAYSVKTKSRSFTRV